MNRQVLIKEYADYGFTEEEIAKELNIDLLLVKSAVMTYPPLRTETPAKSMSKRYYPQYAHATDKNIEFYELLRKHGPRKLNRYIKVFGFEVAAYVLKCEPRPLFALKMHYGYHRPLPGNAEELSLYFPEEVRRQVDGRDHRTCVRCGKQAPDSDIRYHKISHPGPVEADNCATLCKRCRSRNVNPKVVKNRKMFKTMRFKGFLEWLGVISPTL